MNNINGSIKGLLLLHKAGTNTGIAGMHIQMLTTYYQLCGAAHS